ncbi:unnamed protein product [Spirodela intermedia]|uniref:Protein kinase domain-containing protein n=1 Tax=Spirodela intermedia TaxID=51605 RepID=A0A7I8J3W8_SPIIN|nr:unnamed protein product [Spirodela intermedia]CAA6664799.1 unnamed protein product [Spirodela intermedia]
MRSGEKGPTGETLPHGPYNNSCLLALLALCDLPFSVFIVFLLSPPHLLISAPPAARRKKRRGQHFHGAPPRPRRSVRPGPCSRGGSLLPSEFADGDASVSSLFFFFLVVLSSLPAARPDLQSDRAALLAFREAVGRLAVSWNDSISPCAWQGVVCEAGRVVILRLPGAGLIGEIPAGVLGNLTGLRTLSLRFNALSGPLPADLSSLKELRNLYLHDNRLSGEILRPFSGEIPADFNDLKRLRTLYLDRNQLSGQIPDLNLTLDQFNVSYNQLNGSIPRLLRSMPENAFLGLQLCGLPSNPCPDEVVPSSAPIGLTPVDNGGGASVRRGKKKLSGGAIAGIAIGSVVGLLALVLLLCVVCRKKGGNKTRSLEAAGAKPSEVEGDTASGGQSKKLVFCGTSPRVFDLEDLLRASAEVLGKGTFGTAYKAVLEMGTVVAVKRLRDVNLPEEEFREKIEAVGAMTHPNLVPLWAYYFSKDEKLLVYDYMPMGSLSSLLHGSRGSGRSPLHWETRVSIALAAARGIEYIHSTGPSSSHGNIKSSNILLDKPQNARVSDHGLSHLAGHRRPQGFAEADVYSFGVLLLELLTGKAPAQALLNEEGVDLPRWVQSVVREEWTSEVFDSELLRYQNVEEEMMQLLQLAVDCTVQYPDKRPSMAEVVARIEDIHRSSVDKGESGLQPEALADGGGGTAAAAP